MKSDFIHAADGKIKVALALALSGAAALCLACPSVYAQPITSVTEDNAVSQDVTLTFKQNDAMQKVYSVDVVWGNLDGVYTNSKTDRWDPAKHEYVSGGQGEYSGIAAATVTVKNHSNAGVTVTPSYKAARGFEAISGEFDESSKVLPSAVGTPVDGAPSASLKLTLSGDAANLFAQKGQKQTVGTATVVITAAE